MDLIAQQTAEHQDYVLKLTNLAEMIEHNARAFPFPGEAGRGSSPMGIPCGHGRRPLGRLPGFCP